MHFEVYLDHVSEWRWQLLAATGHVLADSDHGFTSEAECLRDIGSCEGVPVSIFGEGRMWQQRKV